MTGERVKTAMLPAPTGGKNSRDGLHAMGAADALALKNVFPENTTARVRRGFDDWADCGAQSIVGTLFSHADPDGTDTLLAWMGSAIYNVSAETVATQVYYSTSMTNALWQTVQASGKGVAVNGFDDALQIDKAVITLNAFTGTGLVAKSLIQGCSFKNRLYFAYKNSASFWYGAPNAVSGALTEYDCGPFLQRGGALQFVASFTQGLGDLQSDVFVVCGQKGDVLVYSGDYPGNTWALVARFGIGEPLGRRAYYHVPGDLRIITDDGVYSLSMLFSGETGTVSDKIDEDYRAAATAYGSIAGWQGTYYPAKRAEIVNYPINSAVAQQFAANHVTGAWCDFSGMNAQSLALHNKKLYFGGPDGHVYLADTGGDDNGAGIPIDIEYSFQAFNSDRIKHFQEAKILGQSTGSLDLQAGLDLDYQKTEANTGAVTVIGPTGTAWGSVWGSYWGPVKVAVNKLVTVTGIGNAAAFKLAGTVKDLELDLNAVLLRYSEGGEY